MPGIHHQHSYMTSKQIIAPKRVGDYMRYFIRALFIVICVLITHCFFQLLERNEWRLDGAFINIIFFVMRWQNSHNVGSSTAVFVTSILIIYLLRESVNLCYYWVLDEKFLSSTTAQNLPPHQKLLKKCMYPIATP